MTEALFRKEGDLIISNKSNRTVAIIESSGKIIIQPGFNAMAKKIHDFLAAPDAGSSAAGEVCPFSSPDQDSAPDAAANTVDDNTPPGAESPTSDVGVSPLSSAPEHTAAPEDVFELPAAELPPFNAVEGVQTPGFMEFCRKHNMNDTQIGLLVRKMEGLIHG
jgi:hypothetical protein